MSDKDLFIENVNNIFKEDFEVSNGTVVPNVEDIGLGNEGREIELAMLFIDIRESTKIVDGFRRKTSAKMYKSFLWGIAQIAKKNSGELRSFNGDGVLVVFSGGSKRTNAAKAGLQMSWFCRKILKPKIESYFELNQELQDLDFNFGIGIDCGKILVIRGGIRGDNNNDLVWVGNATNYAVKLSSIEEIDKNYNIFITEDVYKNMHDDSKLAGEPKRDMWEKRIWNGNSIYRSNWFWSV